MELPFRAVFPMPPAEAFARLRHFPRLYPHLDPAHEPHPPGFEPPLLAPGVAFTVAERFGPERRVYAFRVTRFEEPGVLGLLGDTLTTIGPVRVRTGLRVTWTITPDPGGALVVADQTVIFPRPWLAPLLLPPGARARLRAHVDAESVRAFALLTAQGWPALPPS